MKRWELQIRRALALSVMADRQAWRDYKVATDPQFVTVLTRQMTMAIYQRRLRAPRYVEVFCDPWPAGPIDFERWYLQDGRTRPPRWLRRVCGPVRVVKDRKSVV